MGKEQQQIKPIIAGGARNLLQPNTAMELIRPLNALYRAEIKDGPVAKFMWSADKVVLQIPGSGDGSGGGGTELMQVTGTTSVGGVITALTCQRFSGSGTSLTFSEYVRVAVPIELRTKPDVDAVLYPTYDILSSFIIASQPTSGAYMLDPVGGLPLTWLDLNVMENRGWHHYHYFYNKDDNCIKYKRLVRGGPASVA